LALSPETKSQPAFCAAATFFSTAICQPASYSPRRSIVRTPPSTLIRRGTFTGSSADNLSAVQFTGNHGSLLQQPQQHLLYLILLVRLPLVLVSM